MASHVHFDLYLTLVLCFLYSKVLSLFLSVAAIRYVTEKSDSLFNHFTYFISLM